MAGSAVLLDPFFGSQIINETGISDGYAMAALAEQHPEVAQLARWASQSRRTSNLFERDKYAAPGGIFEQMRVAQDASANDDIVSGVLESTESLAMGKMTFECDDEDEENIWNQIARNIDLESRMREMWRELFVVSQFYAVTWYGRKNFKVSGINPKTGVKRKKEYRGIYCPVGISLLDPLRVVPVGNLLFNQEQLCYVSSDRAEQSAIQQVLDGNNSSDEMISTLLLGEFEPTQEERKLLADLGIPSSKLYVLNPDRVWRVTATRPQYRRFADIRLKSVFELLDLKHQLRENDRSTLIGGTNFIILVTKGSDTQPAKPEELSNLQEGIRTLARVPVIVGDHRLQIQIITPANDHTLSSERHDVLDVKIAARLYQTFSKSTVRTNDDSIKLARVIARGMESRRLMLARAIEKNVVHPTYLGNDGFTDEPALMFHPHQIALDFDPALASFYFDAHQLGDISRQTFLSLIDLDQDEEARKRQREAEYYDDIFKTAVPFDSPQNNSFGGGSNTPNNPADTQGGGGVAEQRTAGRTGGGNRKGGGAAPGTGQGEPPRNPRRKSD